MLASVVSGVGGSCNSDDVLLFSRSLDVIVG